MKIFNLYESLIAEAVSTNVQACVAKYGRELFADQLGGGEPNTNIENDTANGLQRFTTIGYGKNISPGLIKQVTDLKKCVSVYPEVLYPEGTVYRGAARPLGRMVNALSLILNSNGRFNYHYEPAEIIQSWTETADIAEQYASSNVNRFTHNLLTLANDGGKLKLMIKQLLNDDKEYFLNSFKIPVVMQHIATPDQFLFKGMYFELITGTEDSEDNEILRIGKDPIQVHAYIPDENIDAVLSVLSIVNEYLH